MQASNTHTFTPHLAPNQAGGSARGHVAGYLSAQTQKAEIAEETLKFADMIDVVNPLQHIPLVGNAYRAITGDEIKPPARIMGGALFGGPLGAAGSLANVIIEQETGKDALDNVASRLAPQPRTSRHAVETQLARATLNDGNVSQHALAFNAPQKAAASGFTSHRLND